MMKRFTKVFGVTICVLLLSSAAHAAFTVVTDTAQAPEGYFWDGVNPGDPGLPPVFRYYDEDWGWDHDWTAPAGNLGLVSATLEIDAYDVDDAWDPEVDLIYGDGVLLGNLDYDNGVDDYGFNNLWHVTVFNLNAAALAQLGDGEMDIWMNIDSTHDYLVWAVTLRTSKLSLTYLMPDPEPPIPAPGAIVLSSLGVGLLGWLRRRSIL